MHSKLASAFGQGATSPRSSASFDELARNSARAGVTVMQPAEVRDRIHGAIAILDSSRLRRVAVQRLVAPRAVVVRDVLAEDLPQVRLVERCDAVPGAMRFHVRLLRWA